MTDKLKRNAPVVLGDVLLICVGLSDTISQRMMMIMTESRYDIDAFSALLKHLPFQPVPQMSFGYPFLLHISNRSA